MANKKKNKTPNLPPGSAQPPTVSTQTSSKSQPTGSASKNQPVSKKTSQRDRKRRQNIYLAIGAVVAALVVLVGVILVTNQNQQQVSKPAEAGTDLPAEYIARNVKGAPEAKVVVTEYSDFECPYCKTFAQTTQKQLEEEYIKTGKVRFEFKHFPLPQHNPSATFAAQAAECAADQGKFWEMQQYLFQEAGKQGTNTFTQTRLKAMAETLGLNTGDFNKCLSNQEHAKTVQANMREGQQLAVSGTPTIYVNGKKVENPSYPDIKAAIDAALLQQG